MRLSENKLYAQDGAFLGEHSVDVVMLLHKAEQNQYLTEQQSLSWLAEKFGEPRALAAYVVWMESAGREHLKDTRPEREERMRRPRVLQRPEPERIEPQRTTPERPRDSSSRSGR